MQAESLLQPQDRSPSRLTSLYSRRIVGGSVMLFAEARSHGSTLNQEAHMDDSTMWPDFTFPVGYHPFNRDRHMNFQHRFHVL